MEEAGTASRGTDLREVGDRIEQLLDRLDQSGDTQTHRLAEELLALVSELYGAGLARVVELAREHAPAFVDRLADDELVASLLVAIGAHPRTVEERVVGALERVRPMLAAHEGDVELLGIDPGTGVARIRLLGTCDGCPSSALTLAGAVERGITEAAPEIVAVAVESPVDDGPSVPVALGTKPAQGVFDRPAYESCPGDVGGTVRAASR